MPMRRARLTATFTAAALMALATGCDWGDMDGIPAGFADGVDDTGATAAAGGGLTESGGELSVDFAGTGVAASVARSDHEHDADYVLKVGDTMTGELTMNTGGAPATVGAGGIDRPNAAAQVFNIENSLGNMTLTVEGAPVLTTADEGPGNGIDADTVDGQQASAFAPSSHAHSQLEVAGGGSTALSADASGNLTAAGGIAFSTPPIHCLTIPPTAFKPSSTVNNMSFSDWGTFARISSCADLSLEMVAPVNLPEGAVLSQIIVYGRNSNATQTMSITCNLRYGNLATGISQSAGSSTLALSTQTAAGVILNAAGALAHTVDNAAYNYAISGVFTVSTVSPQHLFSGVQIIYTWPEVTP